MTRHWMGFLMPKLQTMSITHKNTVYTVAWLLGGIWTNWLALCVFCDPFFLSCAWNYGTSCYFSKVECSMFSICSLDTIGSLKHYSVLHNASHDCYVKAIKHGCIPPIKVSSYLAMFWWKWVIFSKELLSLAQCLQKKDANDCFVLRSKMLLPRT